MRDGYISNDEKGKNIPCNKKHENNEDDYRKDNTYDVFFNNNNVEDIKKNET